MTYGSLSLDIEAGSSATVLLRVSEHVGLGTDVDHVALPILLAVGLHLGSSVNISVEITQRAQGSLLTMTGYPAPEAGAASTASARGMTAARPTVAETRAKRMVLKTIVAVV